MRTRLTIDIDKEIARQAEAYAKRMGINLSELVEEYLRNLFSESPLADDGVLPPIVSSLKGAVKVDDEYFDYKKILEEELLRKNDLE